MNGNHAADVVPDDNGPGLPEFVQQPNEQLCLGGRRALPAQRSFGATTPGKVRHDAAMVVLEVAHDVRPQSAGRAEAVQEDEHRFARMTIAPMPDDVQAYAVDDDVGAGKRVDVVHVPINPQAQPFSKRAILHAMTTTSRLVQHADVVAARQLLGDVVRVTPIESSGPLEKAVGGLVHLKCENLQRTGSFKIRGAYVRIARLTDEERARGVVAASAGNHAQGVALAARLLDTHALIFMPEGAPLPKVEATLAYGAEIRFVPGAVDDCLTAAMEYAEHEGAVLVHPFDHPDVIAGQGTVGLEILEQVPDLATVVVPVGGGGLISGIAAAIKGVRPDIHVIGVQAEGAASCPPSLVAGHPVQLDTQATIADGIAVGRPGDLTLPHIAGLVDDVVTVSDEDISRALLLCLERAKLVVEPAGVAAVAAVMAHPERFAPPVVIVLSGGNVDPLLLLRVLRHGLAAAGRYLAFRLRIPDRPGELARLLDVLAETQANVLDVEHLRTGPKLHLDEVEVALQLETRGPDHCAAVLARLREAGYPLVLD
jgi:threonine dehydratase